MQIHELLDRFELLYPDNTQLEDLRRSYIDKDMASLFRLLENNHNIDDLRKVILGDDMWATWRVIDAIQPNPFISAIKSLHVNEIKINEDSFSRGQLKSKLWLMSVLKAHNVRLGTIFLCAGWYGILATMLFDSGLDIDKIRSFDIDESTVTIAEIFNKEEFKDSWRFKALVDDIHNIDYNEHTWQFWSSQNDRMSYPISDIPDTIINTSCEHIENFDEWYHKIPKGKLVILQTNDYFEIEDHVNCSKDLDDFAKQTPMNTVLYQGSLNVNDKYHRLMRIGYI